MKLLSCHAPRIMVAPNRSMLVGEPKKEKAAVGLEMPVRLKIMTAHREVTARETGSKTSHSRNQAAPARAFIPFSSSPGNGSRHSSTTAASGPETRARICLCFEDNMTAYLLTNEEITIHQRYLDKSVFVLQAVQAAGFVTEAGAMRRT